MNHVQSPACKIKSAYQQTPMAIMLTSSYTQVFGELEYIFGSLKLIFITMLIVVSHRQTVPELCTIYC
jgi:amino acid permease